ncbi:restriction endonuclease subunit S [Aeromonas salmonicida]|uniref:restriction endonuclease subunit S n=1 Tax=Aeromonas salmonicida TaxID=645 RepID=UPI003BB6309D
MKESVQTQQKGLTGKYYPYPEYKDSGVEWLGEVPSEWIATRLKFIASINMGQSPNSEDCNDLGIGNPFLQGNAEFGQRSPTPKQYCDSAKKNANVGDFLFSVRAPVGAVNIADQRYGIGRGLCAIRSHEDIAHLYLWWVLQTSKIQFDAISTGSTFEAVSSEQVCNFALAIPSKNEQHTIATFLDYETARIDRLIAQQQRLIELLKEKRQSVISHAVTKGLNPNAPMRDSGIEWLGQVPKHWDVSRLKFESDVIDCRNKTPEYFDNGEYFVVRTTNVKNQQLNFNNALYTDKNNFEIWTQRGVPVAGSILFTREAPTGEVCIVPENVKLCMGQRMMNFICSRKIYTSYLFDYLISACLERYINSVSHGSTVSHLRVEQVENIPVPVPPEEELVAIHEHIRILKKQYDILEKKVLKAIELMQERRTALIYSAITGKIDLRGWEQPHA